MRHTWITECLELYNINRTLRAFIGNSMKLWKTTLEANRKPLAQVSIKCGIYQVPCIRVLEPGWNTIHILGVCSGMGPVLTCPWGLCIDSDGDVLVADWGKQRHCVFIYPSKGVGWSLVSENLNNPRGLALLPDGHVVVSDSMNHCIKIYRYK
uniref:Uncharacterized protein n=1 Tax=Oryzias latipes TaxID=8090 RepID=A0A3B3H910_ORYLA